MANLSRQHDKDTDHHTKNEVRRETARAVRGERLALSVAEAARALGIGRATAYECVRTGELPSVKIGGRILIPTTQLLDLLDPEGSMYEAETATPTSAQPLG